ncbi:ricin-type beta-trefoil lectin domain protein [Streptomyces sp. NPDC048362]|uniref:ricin-type beta-trefoil lectin domain protein n=1 Tax=Streptomyces sp. NPDC048362 TaxID=3365539 RepID=UPI0037241F26
MNWADPRDNFVTGPITPVGLSASDEYVTTHAKSQAILKSFQALGANTVRMGINTSTVSGSWWNSYTAAFDAASDLGMNVILAPWLQNGLTGDTDTFYQMWDVVIDKYRGNSHVYFEIMNEPWGYPASQEADVAAAWLAHYPDVPRGRVLVPGSGASQDLCTVGADSRLSGTLLSIHKYSVFGESHPDATAWANNFKSALCGYGSRAVLTEFGAPMTTGVNYNGPREGNNNVSYLYALTDTVRELQMGSLLWVGVKEANQSQGPGPCAEASCALTSLAGNGANISLDVNNQSALNRVRYGWGEDSTGAILAVGSNKCLDVTGGSRANDAAVGIWSCNGGTNQAWTHTSENQLTVYSGSKCLDAFDNQTNPGTPVKIYDCTGGANQQWVLNPDGTIAGVQSGLCMDVPRGSTADGSTIELWECNGGSNQKWRLG